MASAHASSSIPRILVVGAGPSGAVCGRSLVEKLGGSASVELWDKGRGAGGRMSTSRARGDKSRRADLGAQYLTRHGAEGAEWYQKLKDEGVIRPLRGEIIGQRKAPTGSENFVAPGGIGAVVKAIAKGVDIKPGRRVQSLDRVATASGAWQWKVTTAPSDGAAGSSPAADEPATGATSAGDSAQVYDSVVLTIPAPQLLQLRGDIQAVLEESGAAKALQGVKYSSRYALAMWWPESATTELAAAMPWVGKYVDPGTGSDIRYLSFEPRKRQLLRTIPEADEEAESVEAPAGREAAVEGADPPALVAHTGVGFGARRLEADMAAVGAELQAQVRALLPALPEPAEVRCHRWRYSQVQVNGPAAAAAAATGVSAGAGGEDQSTRAAWVVCRDPLLVVAGDGLTESNLDGCIASGEAAAAAVAAAMAGRA